MIYPVGEFGIAGAKRDACLRLAGGEQPTRETGEVNGHGLNVRLGEPEGKRSAAEGIYYI